MTKRIIVAMGFGAIAFFFGWKGVGVLGILLLLAHLAWLRLAIRLGLHYYDQGDFGLARQHLKSVSPRSMRFFDRDGRARAALADCHGSRADRVLRKLAAGQ